MRLDDDVALLLSSIATATDGGLGRHSNLALNVTEASQDGIGLSHAGSEVPNGVSVSLCFEQMINEANCSSSACRPIVVQRCRNQYRP